MNENTKKRRIYTNEQQVSTPRIIPVEEYSIARQKEMKEFQDSLCEFRSQRRVYQTLPPNRRRRAMSRNINYLPSHLRSYALREKTKMENTIKKKKILSRKAIRIAPRKLLIEHLRRTQENHWLETHLWYCKRAVMKNVWGYRLPISMNDRSLRTNSKSSFHKCTIYDISYYECLEIFGDANSICEILDIMTVHPTVCDNISEQNIRPYKRMLNTTTTTTFSREYPITLYYPTENWIKNNISSCFIPSTLAGTCIGICNCIWQPIYTENNQNNKNIQRVWLWVHPTISDIIFTLLQTILYILKYRCPDIDIKITSLAGQFNRFALRGTQSTKILEQFLRILNIPSSVHLDSDTRKSCSIIPLSDVLRDNIPVPGRVYGFQVSNPRVLICHCSIKQEIKDTNNLLNEKSIIYSNTENMSSSNNKTMIDKEFDFSDSITLFEKPKKKIFNITNTKMNEGFIDSVLYDDKSRRLIALSSPTFIKTALLAKKYNIGCTKRAMLKRENKMRDSSSNSAVSTDNSSTVNTDNSSTVNIDNSSTVNTDNSSAVNADNSSAVNAENNSNILSHPKPNKKEENFGFWYDKDIQQYGTEQTNISIKLKHNKIIQPRGSLTTHIVLINILDGNTTKKLQGWDIIIPLGWGNTFWKAAIDSGAKPISMQDFIDIYASIYIPSFPFHYINTLAGIQIEQCLFLDKKIQFFRNLPKRPNYIRLEQPYPFGLGWDSLFTTTIPYKLFINEIRMLSDIYGIDNIYKLLDNLQHDSNSITTAQALSKSCILLKIIQRIRQLLRRKSKMKSKRLRKYLQIASINQRSGIGINSNTIESKRSLQESSSVINVSSQKKKYTLPFFLSDDISKLTLASNNNNSNNNVDFFTLYKDPYISTIDVNDRSNPLYIIQDKSQFTLNTKELSIKNLYNVIPSYPQSLPSQKILQKKNINPYTTWIRTPVPIQPNKNIQITRKILKKTKNPITPLTFHNIIAAHYSTSVLEIIEDKNTIIIPSNATIIPAHINYIPKYQIIYHWRMICKASKELKINNFINIMREYVYKYPNTFLPTYGIPCNRGTISQYTMIYIPTKDEMLSFINNTIRSLHYKATIHTYIGYVLHGKFSLLHGRPEIQIAYVCLNSFINILSSLIEYNEYTSDTLAIPIWFRRPTSHICFPGWIQPL